MKRPNQPSLLGLTVLVTISVFAIPGCRQAETTNNELHRIADNLKGIQDDLTHINKDLEKRVARANAGDQVIGVSLTNPPPGVQVDKDPAEISYKDGNKIAWIYYGNAPMTIVFKDPSKIPFQNVKCGVGNGLSVCLSGPIAGSYTNGKPCGLNNEKAYCFDYKVCLELAPHTQPVCTNDPGIIIHP
jgi:hypothetical protein